MASTVPPRDWTSIHWTDIAPGDAAAVEDEPELIIEGGAPNSEVLVFDLA